MSFDLCLLHNQDRSDTKMCKNIVLGNVIDWGISQNFLRLECYQTVENNTDSWDTIRKLSVKISWGKCAVLINFTSEFCIGFGPH